MSCEFRHPLIGEAVEEDEAPECPSCGEELEFDDDDFAYCPVCGWEE